MKIAKWIFFLPGDIVADFLGATKADDRAMIRTMVDLLFWNFVIVLGVVVLFL